MVWCGDDNIHRVFLNFKGGYALEGVENQLTHKIADLLEGYTIQDIFIQSVDDYVKRFCVENSSVVIYPVGRLHVYKHGNKLYHHERMCTVLISCFIHGDIRGNCSALFANIFNNQRVFSLGRRNTTENPYQPRPHAVTNKFIQIERSIKEALEKNQ